MQDFRGANIIIAGPSRPDGDALPENVLDGKTFGSAVAGKNAVGTMTNQGAQVITPSTVNQPIGEGYHNGDGYVEGAPTLSPDNIREDISIFGVTGNLTPYSPPTGDAEAFEVLSGKTFMNQFGASTGTMVDRTTGNYNADSATSSGTTITLGIPDDAFYGDAATISTSQANFVNSNIKSGVVILGKAGTFTNDATATAADILLGETAYANGVEITGTYTPPGGTATTAQVLAGQTFTNDSGQQTGTMPNNGALGTITPGTTNQTIPAGYTSGGTVAGDGDLVAGNIKSGANIFGVNGSVIQASGSATAAQVLTGQTFSNASGAATGTMPSKGAGGYAAGGTSIAGTSLYFDIPQAAYYADAASLFVNDTDFIAANILSGKNIFGLAGSLIQGSQFASGTASRTTVFGSFLDYGNNVVSDFSITVTGLNFLPKTIMAWLQPASGRNPFNTIYKDSGLYISSSGGYVCPIITTAVGLRIQMGMDANVSFGTFTLPVDNYSDTVPYNWIAFGD